MWWQPLLLLLSAWWDKVEWLRAALGRILSLLWARRARRVDSLGIWCSSLRRIGSGWWISTVAMRRPTVLLWWRWLRHRCLEQRLIVSPCLDEFLIQLGKVIFLL
jgi:hypothetical protein